MVKVTSVLSTKLAAAPEWARLQRELLDKQTEACVEFFEHYFHPDTGYLRAIPRWGGNDGPDDAAENGLNWTVLYALGASQVGGASWVKIPIWRQAWGRGRWGQELIDCDRR